MRAVVCNEIGPPKNLQVEERDDLVAGPGAVVVDVEACGVNFVDALMVQGLYQVKPEPPFVPGSEVAGSVSQIGDGVTGVSLGDRVVAMPGLNGFAEQVSARAESLLKVPKGLDVQTAACFVQSYCTGLFALGQRGGLQEGETILVLGAAGGVGLAAIDLAKAIGARVIAAASSEEKLALCRERGADETIDYSREDLKTRAKELSGGGVDMVYDPVGGDYAEPALRACAPGARYLVIGFAAGEIPHFRANLILLKSCQVVGVDWGGSERRAPGGNDRLLAELAEMIDRGELAPRAPAAFPLEQAGQVLTDLTERRLAGKAVLIPG
ncbi:MAG: NADPH:quinone oxidoreductase family protein [Myxococcota bacterium]|nr:NADPH:quinone oxidoreductase family protein [Myxococcota bacterium]